MNERQLIAVKLITSHILLPLFLCLASFLVKNDALLLVSISQTVLCILFLAGYWEFFGLRFKNLFCAGIQLIILFILLYRLLHPQGFTPQACLVTIFAILQAWLFIVLSKIIFVIFERSPSAYSIKFPFREGLYLVTDGGNSRISRLMNYHYHSAQHKKRKTNLSMLYATDIVKIKDTPGRFMPLKNEEYPIYGEKLYAPMDGLVVKIENTIPDNAPYVGKYPYNTGNTIVIKNENRYLLLGHLRQGSILVKEGEMVQVNQLIAEAGNSGLSERPHLHMQLMESDSENYWFGKGISLLTGGKPLYKNRILKL